MIVGIGIDLVEIASLDLQRAAFLRRVFTPAEIDDCQSFASSAEHFAGRFALKEAFMKAIGQGIRQSIGFTQIEVLNHPTGQPYITPHEKAEQICAALGVNRIHVSTSHTGNYAIGMVILERTS